MESPFRQQLFNVAGAGPGPEHEATSIKWSRPPLPAIDPKTDNIEFQQLDVDYYIGENK